MRKPVFGVSDQAYDMILFKKGIKVFTETQTDLSLYCSQIPKTGLLISRTILLKLSDELWKRDQM